MEGDNTSDFGFFNDIRRPWKLFHFIEVLLLKKQIAFPIDLSPGLDLCLFLIIRRYAVPKD